MAALTARRVHLRPLILLAINTGMRRGELLSLAWRNVDFQRGVIQVTNTKTESLVLKGDDRVHFRCPPRRNPAGEKGYCG